MAQVLSGSVQSGVRTFTNTVGNSNNNWLECHWTATQSGNVSTIIWRIKFCGSGANLQRARVSQCRLIISAVTGTLSTSGTKTVLPYNTGRSFTWSEMNAFAPAQGDSSYSVTVSGTSYLGGTFKVTHSSGVGKFKLQLSANIYEHGAELWGTEVTFELPTTTTACGAPTSVTMTSQTGVFIKPNDSFMVSWSGASAGTNNSIAGYRVYYTVASGGANPTTSSTYVDVNSTATSTTITLTNAARGYIIKCAVQTRGNAGTSYWSGLKQGSNTITINQLPAPPTLDQSSQIIKSTEYTTGISVTAIAGADPDGQAVEVWYKTSQEGDPIEYPNPSTINPTQGNSITWYFYTRDSLEEFSSPTEITITRNLKPVLTVATGTVDTYEINNSNGASGNNLGYAYGMTPRLSCNKNCNLRITRQYRIGSATDWSDGISTLFAYSVNPGIETNLENYNLFEQVPDLNDTANFYWRLKVEVTGDLESSDSIYFPSDPTYYTIAPFMGSGISVFNQFANSNVIGSNQNQIYRQLRIKFPADTSIASYSVSTGNNITGISYVTSTSNNSTQIDVTLPDNINPGTQIVCTVTGQTVTGAQFTRSRAITPVTETLAPDLSIGINAYPTSIKPFTASGTTPVRIPYPFGSGTYSNYNISGEGSVKLKIASDQNGTGTVEVTSSFGGAQWTQDNDLLTKNFNLTDFYDFQNLWNLSYDSAVTYYARIEIENVFGQTFSTPWKAATFNFVENLRSIAIGDFQWSSSSTGTYQTLDNGSNKGRLWEGMYLKINPTISYWTKGTITINLFDTNNTLITTQTINATGATSQTAVNISGEFIIGPLDEFSTSDGYAYKVVAQLNGTTGSVESSVTHPVGKLTTASYVLTSATVEKNQTTYDIRYVINGDAGIDTSLSNTYTITKELVIGSEESFTKVTISSNSGLVNSGLQTWNVQQVRLLTTVNVNTKPDGTNTYTITKESTSPVVIVYSSSPTVAYRANHLGINTNSIDSGATLVVQATSGRNLVLLKGATATIHINLEEARIY